MGPAGAGHFLFTSSGGSCGFSVLCHPWMRSDCMVRAGDDHIDPQASPPPWSARSQDTPHRRAPGGRAEEPEHPPMDVTPPWPVHAIHSGQKRKVWNARRHLDSVRMHVKQRDQNKESSISVVSSEFNHSSSNGLSANAAAKTFLEIWEFNPASFSFIRRTFPIHPSISHIQSIPSPSPSRSSPTSSL